MTRARTAAAFLVLAAGPGVFQARAQALPSETLETELELEDGAAYLKHSLKLKLRFSNRAEAPVTIEASAFEAAAFTVLDAEGLELEPSLKAEAGAPRAEALVVEGFAAAERIVDLSAWFPKLTARRRDLTIEWKGGHHSAGPLPVRVIRRFDERKDRRAVVATDLGTMVWRLLPDHAPRHVKRFVDLSRQGFYDGLTIFKVVPGIQAEGGDPKGNGTGGWSRMVPAEIAKPDLAMGPGLVGASRQETSMTSDFMFFLTLGPSDFMQGMHTFYARLEDGHEVLALLQRHGNKGNTGLADAFLLDPPVRIQGITIKK
ncbi:MAG TPA: peptidylprolyl isomerase [Candidatus Polarisedimenticolia bacterium]|nr:peptidylprolyl isomerase [Candidatus Polarisedimenticolia bacterium]